MRWRHAVIVTLLAAALVAELVVYLWLLPRTG
jgi:hypothetical protein